VNLVESTRQWVLTNLPYDRGDAALVAYLAGLDAHELLVRYHNWNNRLVKPQPRAVHKSKAFQRNLLATQRADDLAQIIADIEYGRDLKKYLSRDIDRAPAKVPGARHRPDLDLLLNYWGVHHLHISSIVEPDGFVKRDRPLLFVSFTSHASYVIDIMMHGDWTRDHVLEVLASEWPHEGVIHEIKGASTASQITEDQRANLRKNGYNAAFTFGGKDFMPGSGVMSDRTTMMAWAWAWHVVGKVTALEQALATNPRCLAPVFARHGLEFPGEPEFEFAVREGDEAGVLETKSNTWMNLVGTQ
jgi:hypothetical protein